MNKLAELRDELKLVLTGRGAGILDALIPLLVFVIANQALSFRLALISSIVFALILLAFRLIKKQSAGFALGGLGTTLLAALLAFISGTAAGYYLPGFITGGLTILACFISVLLGRPIAAYSSHITRRWPLDWYWHPQVKPAYSHVSLFWGIAFSIRTGFEILLFLQDRLNTLGTVRVLMGWPYTIVVLVVSYIFGQGRLKTLQGPGLEEFKNGSSPPWVGQQKGF